MAVNSVDLKVGAGRRNPGATENPPRVIGSDASGIIDSVGSDVALF